ncbi:Glycosyltransferase [Vibrio chagasii]|nr:Glycosyltransferase [Vibrio chagasii]CAH7411807.1 Glycosyltransferase [Vibrio chagasii]CAH7430015.1 Glycosyltransferase [Vibrio chagasii]
MIKNRRILLICPKFFGYEKELYNSLSRLNYDVDYLDERPSNSVLFKFLLRVGTKILTNVVSKSYYQAFCDDTVNSYDYILYFNIESIDKSILKLLKSRFNKAKHILYMWDSSKNKKNFLPLLKEFDRCYSFDPKDSRENHDLIYKPLFSCMNSKLKKRKDIDFSFVGTVHGARLPILLNVESMCKKSGLKTFFYFYYPNRFLWKIRCLIDPKLKIEYMDKVHFVPLDYAQVEEKVKSSKYVLDIQSQNQVGMTMRNIEVVCAGTKLFTTNLTAKNTPFYKDGMVKILDVNNISLPKLDGESDSFDYSEYYIDNWLEDLL